MDVSRQLSAFKRALEGAASCLGVKYGEFRRVREVDLFLIDLQLNGWSHHEVGAKALACLCRNDKSPMDGVVCIAVIEFLDVAIGKPQEDPNQDRRRKDLLELVAERGGYRAYLRWAASWYDEWVNPSTRG